ncbi:MAG: PIG-L deacetylase family protein [Acidobacteriaceae bacterium]
MTTGNQQIVLAIGAHPDDVEISCAGTLSLLKNAGFKVHIASMTLGDCGSKELSADSIRRQRRREAQDAASVLGVAYHYVGSNDFCIFNDDLHNRRVTALLREVAPNIVLTHQPHDYMVDHEATSVLVRNACFYAPAPNYDSLAFSPARATDSIPYLYYWDVMEGVDIFGNPVAPQFYIDVTSEIDLKTAMLAHHASQREWLRTQHGMDEYIETMRNWGQKRGDQAAAIAKRQVKYAEGFRQHLGHAYPNDNILEKYLGNHVVSNPGYATRRSVANAH